MNDLVSLATESVHMFLCSLIFKRDFKVPILGYHICFAVNFEESDKGSIGNDDNSCSAYDINEDSNLSMNDANNDDNEVDNSYLSNEDDENEDNEIEEDENDDDNDDDGGNEDTQNTFEGEESNLVPSLAR